MIEYEQSFPELLSHSQTKMGRGSAVREQVPEKITNTLFVVY